MKRVGRANREGGMAGALARNLRARRGRRTQEQFARQLGVSRPTLTRLENAAQNTTLATLERVCRALRCEVGELLAGGRERLADNP